MSDIIRKALEESLSVMQEEKEAWGGACDLFDSSIELCKKALKELK